MILYTLFVSALGGVSAPCSHADDIGRAAPVIARYQMVTGNIVSTFVRFEPERVLPHIDDGAGRTCHRERRSVVYAVFASLAFTIGNDCQLLAAISPCADSHVHLASEIILYFRVVGRVDHHHLVGGTYSGFDHRRRP